MDDTETQDNKDIIYENPSVDPNSSRGQPKKEVFDYADIEELDTYINEVPKEKKKDVLISLDKVDRYGYIVKRPSDKSFKDVTDANGVEVVHHSQLSVWDTHILNSTNINIFRGLNTPPEKVQFLVNLMIDNNMFNNVLKYDTNLNLFIHQTADQIFDKLNNAFKKKAVGYHGNASSSKKNEIIAVKINLNDPTNDPQSKQKELKTKNKEDSPQYQSIMYVDHPLNSYWSNEALYNNDNDKHDEWMECICNNMDSESSKNVKNNYNLEEYKKEYSHSLFSVIHPMFEEYQLRLYNGSHRIMYTNEQIPTIHASTLVNIKIPAPDKCQNKTFFVIFNSRLVHGGSRTFREGLLTSSFQYNYRLFGFSMLSYKGTRNKIGLENSDDTEDFTLVNTKVNYIDKKTFEICNNKECNACNDALKMKKKAAKNSPTTRKEETVIDVKKEYELKKKLQKSTDSKEKPELIIDRKSRPASYVCGDLDVHGWEIHEGINYMKNHERYKFLRFHLEQINFKASGSTWQSITQSSGRQFVRLTEDISSGRETKQTSMSKQFLTDICFKDLNGIIQDIEGFEDHDMQGHLLMANRKICLDQGLHRDYNKKKSSNTSVSNVQGVTRNVATSSAAVSTSTSNTTDESENTTHRRSSKRARFTTSRFGHK